VTASSLRSLYLHIPFCERKCEYCDFVSLPGRDGEAAYVEALCTEIDVLGERLPGVMLDTVFIGGGTPSYIEPEGIQRLLDAVRARFHIAAGAEVTMEANPSSTSPARAARWLEAGVNRLSLGVQSLEPDVLGFLGRVHDAGRALAAIDDVRSAGFVRVNCDLIYAVPGLDDDRWRRTLGRILERDPGHVSAYELTVEPGTPLHASVRRGQVRIADADVALRQHAIAVEMCTAAGHAQYEVSNYARPGQECRHNLGYWRRGQYLAAGLGAHGHVSVPDARALGMYASDDAVSVRYWHGRQIGAYVDAAVRREIPVQDSESVDAAAAGTERLMLGLRLAEGVDWPVTSACDALVDSALLRREGGRIAVTARGQTVLDEVIRQLTDGAAATSPAPSATRP
jgi:putative oxygen-independent coproporphyrinogen III oxidase